MLHEIELSHIVVEAAINIYCRKGEGVVGTVTRWFKKFCSGSKNFDDQAKSSSPKTEAVLQAIEENPVRKVSANTNITKSSVVCHFHNHGKSIKHYSIVVHVTKIL